MAPPLGGQAQRPQRPRVTLQSLHPVAMAFAMVWHHRRYVDCSQDGPRAGQLPEGTMSKRDVINEIRERYARNQGDFSARRVGLAELTTSFRRLNEGDSLARALHVMGMVASLEVTVREAIKRLIDHGAPFLDRVEGFKEHLRFDFALTKALSLGQITFGDLVAHSLPISSVDHIASHFETLFMAEGKRHTFGHILSSLRVFVEPTDAEILALFEAPAREVSRDAANRDSPPLIAHVEALLPGLANLFRTRHLIAHEAQFAAVTAEEGAHYLELAWTFNEALYELVEQTIHPGASRYGMGISMQALAHAGAIENAGRAIEKRIVHSIDDRFVDRTALTRCFAATVTTFDAYHQAQTAFRLALHGMVGGNAMRNIEADVTTALWEERRAHLEEVEEHVRFYGTHNAGRT